MNLLGRRFPIIIHGKYHSASSLMGPSRPTLSTNIFSNFLCPAFARSKQELGGRRRERLRRERSGTDEPRIEGGAPPYSNSFPENQTNVRIVNCATKRRLDLRSDNECILVRGLEIVLTTSVGRDQIVPIITYEGRG